MNEHYAPVSEHSDNVETTRTEGRRKMNWALQCMSILRELREQFESEQPLADEVIGMAMHVEVKTANLVELLVLSGAEVAITGYNPLSTHDDVSATLDANDDIISYAVRGVDKEGYYTAIDAAIAHKPTATVDNGMDMTFTIHGEYPELTEIVAGGAEETMTGVHRSRAMDEDGELNYPVFAVNDTPMKRLFDNVHGMGEPSSATIAMTTNLSYAGKNVIVGGYGYCGKGVAKKALGQNANVTVIEVDPRRALEAHMEGYDVMPMEEAAKVDDVLITTTGNRDVITREDFENMKDGVLLTNAGHFNIEIDLDVLSDLMVDEYEARDGVNAYELGDGRRLNVLAEGRLVNPASPIALGHPVEVMDQSFGMQAVVVREFVEGGDDYDAGVHGVPDELDHEVVEVKLDAEGIEFDSVTSEQREYMGSWTRGT